MVLVMSPLGRRLCLQYTREARRAGMEQVGMPQVRVVEDAALPAGMPWAIVTTDEGTTLVIRRSEFTSPEHVCALLEQAWAAWRKVGHPVHVPPLSLAV